MARYNVVILQSAALDFYTARKFYRSISRDLNAEIDQCISSVAIAHFAYAVRFDDLRRLNLKQFPYAIYFSAVESSSQIVIHAFLHVARLYPNTGSDPDTLHEP